MAKRERKYKPFYYFQTLAFLVNQEMHETKNMRYLSARVLKRDRKSHQRLSEPSSSITSAISSSSRLATRVWVAISVVLDKDGSRVVLASLATVPVWLVCGPSDKIKFQDIKKESIPSRAFRNCPDGAWDNDRWETLYGQRKTPWIRFGGVFAVQAIFKPR